MNLHDHPVLDTHHGHFGQHLRPKEICIFTGGRAAQYFLIQRCGFCAAEVRCSR